MTHTATIAPGFEEVGPNGVAGAPSGFQLGIIIGCYLGRAQYDFYFLPSTTGDAGKFRLAWLLDLPTRLRNHVCSVFLPPGFLCQWKNHLTRPGRFLRLGPATAVARVAADLTDYHLWLGPDALIHMPW